MTAIVVVVAFRSADPLLAADHVYLDIAMTGSELEAPKPTSSYDLDSFAGLGLAFAVGYQRGMWRADGEWHIHSASALFHSDTIALSALMANGTVDLPLGKFFAFSVGAGVGRATVDVESDTCLDPLGCPVPTWTDTRGSAFAWQYTLALSWVYSETGRLSVGYRQISSSDLGIEDVYGTPFADDYLDMSLAILSWQHRFRR